MKGIDWNVPGIPDGEFASNLKSTVEHTLQTISATYALFHEPNRFSEEYGVDISRIDITASNFDSAAMLMFIHDFYKLIERSEHSTKAADFLIAPPNIDLVRYHDLLGIVHTGEASLLFLEPAVNCARNLAEDERRAFLNSLLIITVVDVASLGFLNQLRLDTYHDVVQKLDRVLSGERLNEIARDDTAERIRRLICSNNRFSVQPAIVNDRLSAYSDIDDLLDRLLYVRFDAGVYVLEPLLRYKLGTYPYQMHSKDVIELQESDAQVLEKWIRAVHELLKNESKGGSTPEVLDLNDRSIKGDVNLHAFEIWAQQVDC